MKPAVAIVEVEAGPTRLDLLLARHFHNASRRAVRELIAAGRVRINGRLARKGDLVRAHDRIRIDDPTALAPPQLTPQADLPVRIIYVDEDLVAVDKPAGMPSHALRSRPTDTVANFLAGRFPEVRGIGSPLEGGLVHRLDNGTSGVLMAARTPEAHRALRLAFRRHAVEKIYLALVHGDITAAGNITAPIAHAKRGGPRMRVGADVRRARRARPAATHYRPLRRYGSTTLIEVMITTGVRHQIRVHLASIEHPLLGDDLYGDKGRPKSLFSRLLLHAVRLRFPHPRSGKSVAVEAPLAPDFAAVMEDLDPTTN